MKNVQVTLKEIQKDVMKYILYDLFRSLVWCVLIIIAALVEWVFLPEVPLTAISAIPLLIAVILCGIDIFLTASVKKMKVASDVLSNKRDCGILNLDHDHRHRKARPARLFFNYEGNYDIYYDLTYYGWSSINVMDVNDLYDTSCVGDTFTVVKIRNKIRAVYNHRFFDVQYPKT